MNKEKIIVDLTSDYMECELCGSDSAYSCEISVNNWSFGGQAVAHCYGGYSKDEEDCFIALFKHLSIDFEIDHNKDFDLHKAISFLSSLGYVVELNENLYDAEDYFYEFGNEQDYDDYDD